MQWIAIECCAPDEGEDVLIITPGGMIDVAMFLQGKFSGYPRVTHWMKLPSPPTE